MPEFPPRRVIKEHTLDAVVVVPGIMGSVLLRDGRPIWGFSDPRTYVSLWTDASAMSSLGLTERELDALAEGTYDPRNARVQVGGLLEFPGFAPITGGFEPYTRLVQELKKVAAHRDAVGAFPYDWRLPVHFNSKLLHRFLKAHLAAWRSHPAYVEARRVDPERRDAGLTIVAHSMGGLVAQGLGGPGIEDGFRDVRRIITLGTPFYGSVKSAVLLSNGESPVPLPRRRLRKAVITMPGVYDLLPRGRCVPAGPAEVTRLDAGDVESMGGRRDLAENALGDYAGRKEVRLPGHRPIVGILQPTWQSLELRDGAAIPAYLSYRFDSDDELLLDDYGRPLLHDDQGDGTVWRYSARPKGADAVPLAQQHGALAKSEEAISTLAGIVTDRGDLGAVSYTHLTLPTSDLV